MLLPLFSVWCNLQWRHQHSMQAPVLVLEACVSCCHAVLCTQQTAVACFMLLLRIKVLPSFCTACCSALDTYTKTAAEICKALHSTHAQRHLLSTPTSVHAGGSITDRHDVFVDKQKRTWVSNLAAFQIASSADFTNVLALLSRRRHQSSSCSPHAHPSHGPSTCVVTLLVTADVPTASVPCSAKRRRPQPQAGVSPPQEGSAVTRVCSKLSFVEVGSSAVAGAAAPARTLSAGPLRHQLSRTSTSVSTVSSYAHCSSMGDRRQSVPGGEGSARGAEVGSGRAGKGKAQVCCCSRPTHSKVLYALWRVWLIICCHAISASMSFA